MNFFKVELLPDGSVLSVSECEARGRNGSLIVYVQARDRAHAVSEAVRLYTRVWTCGTCGRDVKTATTDPAVQGKHQGKVRRGRYYESCAACVQKKEYRAAPYYVPPAPPSPQEAARRQAEVVAGWQQEADTLEKCIRRSDPSKTRVYASSVLEVLDRAGPERLRLWLTQLIEKGEADAPF